MKLNGNPQKVEKLSFNCHKKSVSKSVLYKGGEEKEFKEEKTECDVVSRQRRKRRSSIDGWGIVLTIIGLALVFLGVDIAKKQVGSVLLVIGVIRTLYILLKYG